MTASLTSRRAIGRPASRVRLIGGLRHPVRVRSARWHARSQRPAPGTTVPQPAAAALHQPGKRPGQLGPGPPDRAGAPDRGARRRNDRAVDDAGHAGQHRHGRQAGCPAVAHRAQGAGAGRRPGGRSRRACRRGRGPPPGRPVAGAGVGAASGVHATAAWTRSEWLDQTLDVWRKPCDPVAERIVGAMGELVPEEMRSQLGPMTSMVASLGGALFGGQLGTALGSLAAEVLSAGDIGLPLGPAGTAALVPANIAEYGKGLELPEDQVRLYVALREAAHQRLFGHVPWLRGHVLAAVEAYAAGIRVNREAVEEAVSRLDPANPEGVQEIALEGIFTPDDSPQQKAALTRLETALALVEGWVCHVVDRAAADRLPDVVRLSETFRRRRAAGGPAEQTFSALVGLDLRPRRLREATALWGALAEHRGTAGRDALWGHPDLLPDEEAFADPQTFAKSQLDLDDLDFGSASPPAEPE